MRKNVIIPLVLVILFCSASCSSEKTELQRASNLPNKMSALVEDALSRNGITYESVEISINPILDGMDTNWQGFDLISEDGDTYVVIFRKSKKGNSHDSFEALLDNEGRLIEGMIGGGVTPALYENGDYIFQKWFDER